MIGMSVAHAVHYDALVDQAARAGDPDGDAALERSGNLFETIVVSALGLLLAVWLAVAAIWLRRGSNVARVLTLVGLGAPAALGLLACLCGGLGGVLLTGLFLAASDETVPDDEVIPAGSAFYDELDRLDSDGWSTTFGVTATIAGATATLLGI